MKIFVTGATGFIGSHFINLAIKNGFDVVGLKRSLYSKPRIELDKEPNWLVKSIDELEENDFKGIDIVVHLAAHSMQPPYDSLENCMYWNVIAPIKAFQKAVNLGLKKFVIAGSCFEYGESGLLYKEIPVNAPLRPTLSYSASKAASSIAFYQMAVQFKLSLSYFRIFHVFGEGESNDRLWPSLKRAAIEGKDFPMTKGEQIRDFIPVEYVCKRLLEQCKRDNHVPFIENLGTGIPKSILEFSQYWWEVWNATGKLLIGELDYRDGEIMRYVPKID
ncbi:NAD-dependent epimerase/dehydratase family protein [Belliella pelovolcani]|uniref:Nucleoside-diphosphate-sugar epimerase n=1 Tax=Belliella pelovolcani TaxID=529505 RepID=A0A1N7MEJ9_9BACT|nr:NAD-dependent epimerase/dehydratase family protein [Belliella pelovolcani]SIS84514.1 Nucleoside-diphosphate-sugar epimerase [Belliella pelovolcani]